MTRPAREIPTDPAHTIRKMRIQKKHTPLIRIKRRKETKNIHHLKAVLQYLKLKTSGSHIEH
jgi:hypothetical protein